MCLLSAGASATRPGARRSSPPRRWAVHSSDRQSGHGAGEPARQSAAHARTEDHAPSAHLGAPPTRNGSCRCREGGAGWASLAGPSRLVCRAGDRCRADPRDASGRTTRLRERTPPLRRVDTSRHGAAPRDAEVGIRATTRPGRGDTGGALAIEAPRSGVERRCEPDGCGDRPRGRVPASGHGHRRAGFAAAPPTDRSGRPGRHPRSPPRFSSTAVLRARLAQRGRHRVARTSEAG